MNRTPFADRAFHFVCASSLAASLGVTVWFVLNTVAAAMPSLLDRDLRLPITVALRQSLILVAVALLLAVPSSIGAAVHLEQRPSTSRFTALAERSIALLASIPSILYGVFVLMFFSGLFGVRSTALLSALALALLLFPMLVQHVRDAFRSVPSLVQEASVALGADRWHALLHVTMPMAAPRIVVGILFATARALGAAAPLIVVGAFAPATAAEGNSVLSLWIFEQSDPASPAASSVAVLILVGFVVALHALGNWLSTRHDRSIRRQGLSEVGLP